MNARHPYRPPSVRPASLADELRASAARTPMGQELARQELQRRALEQVLEAVDSLLAVRELDKLKLQIERLDAARKIHRAVMGEG